MDVPVDPPTAVAVPSPPMRKLPLGTLIGTSIYMLGANALWLSFNSIILPAQIESVTSPASKDLYLGLTEGVGIGVAIIVNIIAGIISDHFTTQRFGRRAPIMLIGALLTVPFLLLGVFFPVTLPLAFASYVGMQMFSNISASAFQPILADFIPESQHGISAGLQGLFTIIGSALGFVVIDVLLSHHQLGMALIVLAVMFVGTTVINVLAMRPYDKTDMPITPIHLFAALRHMFRLRPLRGGFYWFIFGSFLIYMGLSNFQTYNLYYLEAVLGQNQSQALISQGTFGAVALLVSVIFAVGGGLLSDHIGRRDLIIGAVIIATLMCLTFPAVPQLGTFSPFGDYPIFLVVASIYASSIAVVQSVDTALVGDLVPLDEAGKYMAFANLATGVANAAAPPIFGFILYIQGAPTTASFTAFFLITALLLILSVVVIAGKVARR